MWLLDFLMSRNGDRWFGTNGSGVVRFDGMTCTVFNKENSGLKNDHVFAGAEDLDGTIWAAAGYAGTSKDIDGACSYDGREWKWLDFANSGLPASTINDIVVDVQNVKWFATKGKGLVRFDGATWTTYTTANSGLPSDDISLLFFDSRRRLWIGTQYTGLTVYDGSTWTRFTEGNSGLVSDGVYSIAEGPDGALWFATALGVCTFFPEIDTVIHEHVNHPEAIALLANRPNPFNPSTTIEFSLPAPGTVKLAVYDITGRKVRELLSAPLSAGKHTAAWNGADSAGRPAASGVYFSRLECGGRAVCGKLMLVR